MSMSAPRRSHIRAMAIKYSSLRGQNNGVVAMQLKRCKEEQRQGGEESMAQDNGQTFAKSVRKNAQDTAVIWRSSLWIQYRVIALGEADARYP
jgi:hypothetical protein